MRGNDVPVLSARWRRVPCCRRSEVYAIVAMLGCTSVRHVGSDTPHEVVPSAAASTPSAERRTLALDDGSVLRYSLIVPPTVAIGGAPLPLVLVLHYSAPTDSTPPNYGEEILERLVRPALGDLRAVVVAPDAPERGWTNARSERAVLALLAHLRATISVDERRTLVTGFSAGGMGAWYFVSRHSELFRAALPVASFPMLREGRGAADRETQLRAMDADTAGTWTAPFRRVPMYIIHSEQDEVLPFSAVERAVAVLRAHGATAELVRLHGVTHGQTRAYVESVRAAVPWIERQWARPE